MHDLFDKIKADHLDFKAIRSKIRPCRVVFLIKHPYSVHVRANDLKFSADGAYINNDAQTRRILV